MSLLLRVTQTDLAQADLTDWLPGSIRQLRGCVDKDTQMNNPLVVLPRLISCTEPGDKV